MILDQKLKTGQFLIDTETKQITFSDLRFYTPDNGITYFPSVTTILDAYPKSAAFYEWLKKMGEDADTIRDEAGARGSNVHTLTERYDNGEIVSLIDMDGKIRFKTSEWKMFEKYVDFCDRFQPEIIQNEFNIISPELGTAGTLDRVIRLKVGKTIKKLILDIKTSNGIQPHYWLQLAAYKKLYEEIFYDEPVDGVCILWLNAKTRGEGRNGAIQGEGWQLIFPDQDVEYYWNLFKCTQTLWNEVNGTLKPNNLVYCLEHKKELAA